jgi:phosphoribosylformimino-5-aminoimidazole carboxamide ribotide isomerase
MILLPAIDLMGGEVVRLQQGRAEAKTVYSNDPVAFARKWQDAGGDYLHIVDLDAAFTGEQRNLELVRAITSSVTIPCELGGGMRDESAISQALDAGVARVVIGTRASESIEFVAAMVAQFGPDRIVVGIDARNGCVAVRGWTETSPRLAVDLAREVEAAGARTIIYTDIATDGMLTGPNFDALTEMASTIHSDLIASGGIATTADLTRLAAMPGITGAIIGKALYDGKLDLRAFATA